MIANNKQITLKEYEFLQCKISTGEKNYIDKNTFEELELFITENEQKADQFLTIGFRRAYGKVLIAKNYVGVIQTKNGITIEILPKIPNDINESKKLLLKMLRTLKNSPFKNSNYAHLKTSNMNLLEIFISMFLDELGSLIKKGIKSDYILKEENQKFLKGKLIISQQVKQNHIHKERFYVGYENYLPDRVENRIIKSTLLLLTKKSKANKNQKRIREFLFIFDEVSTSKNIKIDCQNIKLNRQLIHYTQSMVWCNIFLFNQSFTSNKGKHVAFALLYDMNLLFESYVCHWIKKADPSLDIKCQDRKYHLAYSGSQGKFQLKPDIVIGDDEIIADTKWKILSEEKTNQGVSQADMYQLYAYGTKYKNCKQLYLIYPTESRGNIKKLTEEKYDYFNPLDTQNMTLEKYDYFNPLDTQNMTLKLNIIFFNVGM